MYQLIEEMELEILFSVGLKVEQQMEMLMVIFREKKWGSVEIMEICLVDIYVVDKMRFCESGLFGLR